MSIAVVVVLVLLLAGGGGYYRHNSDATGLGVATVLLIAFLVYLLLGHRL